MHHCDFKSALKIINQDFGLNLDTKSPKKVRIQNVIYNAVPITNDDPAYKLDFIPAPWTIQHYEYWEKYELTPATIHAFGIEPVQTILSSGKIIELHDEIAFAFTENLPYVKILRPFADKRSKWRNTCPKHLVHFLHAERYYEEQYKVITKSLKDVMVLHQMSIPAVAVMSESAEPSWYSPELIQQMEGALVLMDNDEAGKVCAAKWEEAGYKTIFVPEEYKAKDISDLVLEIGFENAKAWIMSCLDSTVTQD